MAVQIMTGASGAGKTYELQRWVLSEAQKNPEKNYYYIVPDQFTLETQKELVRKSGENRESNLEQGISNIDVLSFSRLAFRGFEKFPAMSKTILDDTGKTMLLRKVLEEEKDNLTFFKKGINKPGFLDECKSLLCEFKQYSIGEDEFDKMGALGTKFQDIKLISRRFDEKLGDSFIMAEELMDQFTPLVTRIPDFRDAIFCLDGFTGFTPNQYALIEELMRVCETLIVTITTDSTRRRNSVFGISYETIRRIIKSANNNGIMLLPEWKVDNKPIDARYGGNKELAFLEENIFAHGGESYDDETESICLYTGETPGDEIRYVATKIWWLVASGEYQYEDIAVIAGDINAYQRQIIREFDRIGIRYFVDNKKNINANWMAEFVDSAIQMVDKNMDQESVFRFLRCGLSPLERSETDVLENYVIATGKRGISTFRKEWRAKVRLIDEGYVNQIREKFMEAINPFVDGMRGGKKSVEEFSRAVYELIERTDCYERLIDQSQVFEESGDKISANEYKRAYNVIIEIIDELVELIGDEILGIDEYANLIRAGVSDKMIGFIPPKKNQVVVGDTKRTRLKAVKVLFFVGLRADCVPSTGGAPGIINMRERKLLEQAGIELAPNGNRKLANDLFNIYLNIAKPSEKLFLTHCTKNNKGESLEVSSVLSRIMQQFTHITREKCDDNIYKISTDKGRLTFVSGLYDGIFLHDDEEANAWKEILRYNKNQLDGSWVDRALHVHFKPVEAMELSDRAVEMLYGNNLQESITKLERFINCPFSFFLKYGLKLGEREEYSVSALDFGNIVHEVLEKVSEDVVKSDRGLADLEEQEIVDLVEDEVDKAVEEYQNQKFSQSKRVEYMVRRFKIMITESLMAMVAQMKRGRYNLEFYESSIESSGNIASMKVEIDENKRISFAGKIDRIDLCKRADEILVKIIDYKTGAHNLSLSDIYNGIKLQLVMYMAAAMEKCAQIDGDKKPTPAGMYYFHVKEPSLEIDNSEYFERSEEHEKSIGDKKKKSYMYSGYTNSRVDVIQSLDDVFGDGPELEGRKSSDIYKIKTKADGGFDSSAQVLSEEDWRDLMDIAVNKAAQYGKRIFDGDIGINPLRCGKTDGCEYCPMNGICGVEQSNKDKFSNRVENLDDKEVVERLKRVRGNGGDEDELD
ncbi:MAG: PD-(D/E)XK nuclease family protein [Eubacterium sp.]|nr:PD-(D/E)XK nuclease family protein [Eubacterium sp.]